MAALLDHLWQSSLFALGAGLLALCLRGGEAKTRYWLWFLASVKFLVPFSLLVAAGDVLAPPLPSVTALPMPLYMAQQAAQPFAVNAAPALAEPQGPSLYPMMVLGGLWGVGVAAVLIYWLFGWLKIRRASRAARLLPIAAPIPVKATAATLGPGLFGFWRPVLLLPDGIAERLSATEMNAIIAHELCHLRRRDNWTAILHMLVEALFWFHPLVWWIGARLNLERERACDESVVKSGNDPHAYADGILKVCRFYAQSPLPCASGVSSASLQARLETIMDCAAVARLKRWQIGLLGGSTLVAIAWPLLTGWVGALQDSGLWAGVPSLAEVARASSEEGRPRKEISLSPALLDRYAGYYQFAPNIVMRVVRQGSHLYDGFSQGPLTEIFPESETKFFFKVMSAQIAFDTDPGGNVRDAVWLRDGAQKRAGRISVQQAAAIDARRIWQIQHNIPNPGTEAALRYFIAQTGNGRLPSEIMTPTLLILVRPKMSTILQPRKEWGAFESLHFTSEDHFGRDFYDADFAHARVRWLIEPLEGGKLDGMYSRQIYPRADSHVPSPGTGPQLRRFILSLERGQPDYNVFARSSASVAVIKQNMPALRASLKNLGDLQSLIFVSADDEGMDVYDAIFAHGRSQWHVAPLAADGKIQRLYFPSEHTVLGG